MKKNMGNADRVIRVILAVVFAFLWYKEIVPGTLGIVMLFLAGIFLLTSLVGFCPLYRLFGMNSCPRKAV